MFTENLGGRSRGLFSAVLAVGLLCFGLRAQGVTYTFTTIDVPSADKTECDGISGDQIAGIAFFSGTPNGQFILQSGTFSQSLFELSGQVTGISDGALIGYQQTDTSHPGIRSFVEISATRDNDQYDEVNPCYALGIDQQNIVGMRDLQDNSASVPQIGFTYNLATQVFNDLINPAIYPELVMPKARSGNLIVGNYVAPARGGATGDAFIYDGVRWTTIADPNAAPESTFPSGISGTLVVGSYTDAGGATHGFTYDIGTDAWATIDDSAGSDTVITGVSGTDLVGYFTDGSAKIHGFYASASGATAPSPTPTPVPTPTPGPTPNPYLFQAINVPGGRDTTCAAVYGTTIAGSYFDSREIQHGFVQTPSGFLTLNYPAPHSSVAVNTMVAGIYGEKVFGAYYTGKFDANSPNATPFLYDLKTHVYTSLAQLGTGLNFTGIYGTQVLGYSPRRSAIEFGEKSVIYDFAAQTTSDFTIPFTTGYQSIDSAVQVAVAISGTSYVGWDVDNAGYTRGFLAQGSVEMPLDEPNAYNVGNTDNQSIEYAFFPASLGTQPTGVDGTDVVGNYWDSSLVQHGFIFDTNGGWTTIDCPLGSGTFTNVAGVSQGEVVGSYQDSRGDSHGFAAIAAGGAAPTSGTAGFTRAMDPIGISGVVTNLPGFPFDAGTLLQFFGDPEVQPARTRYYFDRASGVVVLGSKELAPPVIGQRRAPETIYGEVFRYGSQKIGTMHRDGMVAVSGTCSMVNDRYTGTFTGWARHPATYTGDHLSISVPAGAGNSSVGIEATLDDFP
jgi:hypothetical protein